jgi:DNA-directed RNA polymerase II subunit RPB1
MKMLVEFKAPKKKNDDREQLSESVEPKQILSAERVFI